MELDSIGKWAFIVGLVIAILAGFITTISATTSLLILFILGLIVGLLNIDKKNTTEFLVAVIALLAVGSLGRWLLMEQLATTVGYLQAILNNFTAFVAAAALVVSIKAVVEASKK